MSEYQLFFNGYYKSSGGFDRYACRTYYTYLRLFETGGFETYFYLNANTLKINRQGTFHLEDDATFTIQHLNVKENKYEATYVGKIVGDEIHFPLEDDFELDGNIYKHKEQEFNVLR